jgi:5-methylcytosine-specific restriction enzyme A
MPILYGRRWGKKRAAQLTEEPFCRLCDAAGRITRATVADHIEPHRDDPVKFWAGELQSLCETCHNAVKQAQEKSGTLRGVDANGIPLDPNHHWNR